MMQPDLMDELADRLRRLYDDEPITDSEVAATLERYAKEAE